MPTTTPIYGLLNGTAAGDTIPSAALNTWNGTAEDFYVQLGELHGAGCFAAGDFNLSAGSGLAVNITPGSAFVGISDQRKLVHNTAAGAAAGLTPSATNYVYLQRDGTFVFNTTGTAPVNTILVGTAATSGSAVTSVNNLPAGRVNLPVLPASGPNASVWSIPAAGGAPLYSTTPDLVQLFTSGAVGIGTNAPARMLEVVDAANVQLRLTQTPGTVYCGLQANSAGNLYINPTGARVGINIASPAAALNVGGNVPAAIGTTPGTTADTVLTVTGPAGGNTTNGTGKGGTGSAVSVTSGAGGLVTGTPTTPAGGDAGALSLQGGNGGASASGTSTNTGGAGASINISAGNGGAATGAASGNNTGGTAGGLVFQAGTGGAASGGAGTNLGQTGGTAIIRGGTGGIGVTGGTGGNCQFFGGNAAAMDGANAGQVTIQGGAASATASGGNGGTVTIKASDAAGDNSQPRFGGFITITAGNGRGSQTGGTASMTGGIGGPGPAGTGAAGGPSSTVGGAGGGGGTVTAGGLGGAANLTGGAGGAGTTTSGNGGPAVINGGAGGATGTPGARGAVQLATVAGGNVAIFSPGSFGGGVGVIGIANAGTVPASNPAGGGVLYASAGGLYWRGSAGTVTPVAPA